MTCSVRVEPSGVEFTVEAGETVMAAAVRVGLRWPTICGGKGLCGACRMEVTASDGPEAPLNRIEEEARAEGRLNRFGTAPVRLACQLRPTGDLTVRKAGVRAAGPPRHRP